VLDSNREIVPVATSAGVNRYALFITEAFDEKLPVPDDDHTPVLLPPVTVPFIEADALVEQSVCAGDAITEACRLICTDMELLAGEHPPLLVDVRVKMTAPEFISAAVTE
jgi:hypothetical protein